jgi:Uncharacterized conserved protein (DUF2075)
MPVLDVVRHSKFRPSKKLMSHIADIVDGQKVYVLLDSQRVVYERVLAEVRAATSRQRKKTMVLVRGGPGTGKSVVALKLLGDLNRAGVISPLRVWSARPQRPQRVRLLADRRTRPIGERFLGPLVGPDATNRSVCITKCGYDCNTARCQLAVYKVAHGVHESGTK